jgi:hypothetical protein
VEVQPASSKAIWRVGSSKFGQEFKIQGSRFQSPKFKIQNEVLIGILGSSKRKIAEAPRKRRRRNVFQNWWGS